MRTSIHKGLNDGISVSLETWNERGSGKQQTERKSRGTTKCREQPGEDPERSKVIEKESRRNEVPEVKGKENG